MYNIEADPHFTSIPSGRNIAFNTVSSPASKISKLKTDKKNSMLFSAEQIQKEILQEIKQVESVLKEVQKHLPDPIYEREASLNELKSMEESIRRKTQVIKNIEEQIKMLKNGTYFDQKKNSDQPSTLVSEIQMKKANLLNVQKIYMSKIEQVRRKREMLRAVEQNFQNKCKKEGIKGLTFEQFKQIETKKKKQQLKVEKLKKPMKKQFSSIKEIVSGKGQQNTVLNTGSQTKKMKDLLAKKNVAETALKAARRRHGLEINDLTGKLEFLRDEYHDLEEKLLLKEQELREAENKFSQSRNSSDKKLAMRRYRTEKNF